MINVPAFIAAAEKLGGCNGADLYRLLLFTGMRKSEGMRLQWEHVDLTADTLLIPKTKNGTPLELPLSVQVKNILLSRWNIWNRPSTGPVFPSRSKTGHTVQDGYIAGKVKMFIPGFSAHWLRSAFTTAAVSAKIDGMVIDRITNHAAKGITARHYYKPTVGDLREPMQKIADKIEEHALCCRLHPDLKHVV